MQIQKQQSLVVAPSRIAPMYDTMIEETKLRITDHKKDLEGMQPKLADLDQRLRQASKEYYDQRRLCEEKKFQIDKDIELVRSLKEKRHKVEAGKVEWLHETYSILRKEDKFLTVKEIWDKINRIPEVKRSIQFMKQQVNMDQFHKKLIAAAEAPMQTRSLVMHEDGFGLPSWVDREGVPIDNYGDRFKFATVLNVKRTV